MIKLVTRKELQELSKVRLAEANMLLDQGLPNGAFYLAGYAVECALKACIAKTTRRGDFPDKKRVDLSHSHNLLQLLKVAGLEEEFHRKTGSDPDFRYNWSIAESWSEQSRYRTHSMETARKLLEAIGHRRHGVILWITQRS
jgi:HEPN domain-containing protein